MFLQFFFCFLFYPENNRYTLFWFVPKSLRWLSYNNSLNFEWFFPPKTTTLGNYPQWEKCADNLNNCLFLKYNWTQWLSIFRFPIKYFVKITIKKNMAEIIESICSQLNLIHVHLRGFYFSHAQFHLSLPFFFLYFDASSIQLYISIDKKEGAREIVFSIFSRWNMCKMREGKPNTSNRKSV